MELTGKCKQDFEKWLVKYANDELKEDRENWLDDDGLVRSFYDSLLPSMQYGVYVDFFDSVGINITFNYFDGNFKVPKGYRFEIEYSDYYQDVGIIKTRQEARTEAIKKANEIYNLKPS